MQTKIYAHRGSRGQYPENTMLAFSKAIQSGADGIELDVHLSKDGEVVVIHDATLERTTTGSGYVKDQTYAEIRTHSAGKKFNEYKRYASDWDLEAVPTLTDVLALVKESAVSVNIELKTHEVQYPNIEKRVLDAVAASGLLPHQVVYSAFHLPTLLRLQQLEASAQVAWLLEQHVPMPMDYVQTFNLEALHIDKALVLTQPDLWQPMASKLRVWTANNDMKIKRLLELGVAAIITDYPERALKLREAQSRTT